jgi:hypothetical protein
MDTKAMNKKSGKPFIKLMENKRIAKFFLSAILEQQISYEDNEH